MGMGFFTKTSFTLGGHLIQNVASVCVTALHLTTLGDGKTLGCATVGFDFRHLEYSSLLLKNCGLISASQQGT